MSEIIHEIEEFLSTLPIGTLITTQQFKDALENLYGRSRGSYIPSDYCYNWKNKGIDFETQPHYFLKDETTRGLYKYVGKNYIYNGPIYCNPKKYRNLYIKIHR